MIVDIVSDSRNKCSHVVERASTDAFDGKLAQPTLDQVQPGTGRRNKVQVEPWMPFEPGLHPWVFVSTIIVHDQMKFEPGRSFPVYSLEETDKLLMPMAWHAVADHLAIKRAEGCK